MLREVMCPALRTPLEAHVLKRCRKHDIFRWVFNPKWPS